MLLRCSVNSNKSVLFFFPLRIGRHSKSLDTQRFVCALCTGQLVLLTPSNTRGPTPFATFVKENYGTVRQELAGQSHAEVMRKLSADFASKTRLSQSWLLLIKHYWKFLLAHTLLFLHCSVCWKTCSRNDSISLLHLSISPQIVWALCFRKK